LPLFLFLFYGILFFFFFFFAGGLVPRFFFLGRRAGPTSRCCAMAT
jgi:hypothetical protein